MSLSLGVVSLSRWGSQVCQCLFPRFLVIPVPRQPGTLSVAGDAQGGVTFAGRNCPSLFRFEKPERLLPGSSMAALKPIDSLNSTSPHGLLVNWTFPTCIYASPQMVDIISTTLCSAVLLQSTATVLNTMRTSQFHKKGTCLQLPCPFLSCFPL